MKRLLALAAFIALPLTAEAQQVCAFRQYAAPVHVHGPGHVYISGFICRSEEAAIAAARHYLDQYEARQWLVRNYGRQYNRYLDQDDITTFVNGVRNEPQPACYVLTNVVAKVGSGPTTKRDQFSRTLSVRYFQVKEGGITGTVVTANYIDGC